MARETAFIDLLRPFATHPGARSLLDDAAVLPTDGRSLVLTHDMMVEGVHYLPDDAPADVAWKLVAVNLSDLAAKGAEPVGALVGYAMTDDRAWDAAFARGLGEAASRLGVPLLGGDTVRMPPGSARALGLTGIGRAPQSGAPARSGARPGDWLWVSGTIGDAGLGLAIRRGEVEGDAMLIRRYQRPTPRLALGQALAPLVTAMADISDGLLIDAQRIGAASGCALAVRLDAVPLSNAFGAVRGEDVPARLSAATSGDDYELLFTAAPTLEAAILAAGRATDVPLRPVGLCTEGAGITVTCAGRRVPLPDQLGWLHG